MLLKFLFLILFLGVQSQSEECRTKTYPPPASTVIPHAVINLDLPPMERWTHLVKDKEKELKEILKVFQKIIGEKYLTYVNTAFGILTSFLPEPYRDEIRGISIAANIERGEVAVYNVFYELFTACTSIVGQDETGKLFHARNMDFGLLMGWDTQNNTWLVSEWLRKLLVQVDFQRGGKTVYRSVTFIGYIGVLTAVKKNAFTFTIDERFVLDGGWLGLIEWFLKLGKSEAKWLGFLTREVMENATSYDEAKMQFSKKELIAPAYFILGGVKPGEGCIITRDRKKAADIWELKSDDNPDQWYILETNYDRWKKPLFIDDRRTTANKCMKEMTQKSIGPKGLFNVLSTQPVLNKLTVYTAIMQVNNATIESYVQYCRDPCWPW